MRHASRRVMWHTMGVTALLSVPPWLVALALAITAPMCVRYVADAIERRARGRTAEILARADRLRGAVDQTRDVDSTTGADRTDGAPVDGM